MPLYEYACEACGQRFEAIQKYSDAPLTTCKACGKGPVEKLLSSPAIQFKGEGWYITDYARKGQKDQKEGGESGAKAAKSDDGKPPEKKTEAAKSDTAPKKDSGSKPAKAT